MCNKYKKRRKKNRKKHNFLTKEMCETEDVWKSETIYNTYMKLQILIEQQQYQKKKERKKFQTSF